jgi:uncharacterized protein YjbI with pentapeptide repeats
LKRIKDPPSQTGASSAATHERAEPSAKAFAAKARDLEVLRDAVVDAASVGAGLWFSYLFVLFYLAIAVGSVTHRDLLFEAPVKLPFLNVDLPLIGFFVLGPGLFLIVHAYVLLHFVLLAGKAGIFHAELDLQIADEETKSRLRRQLPSNIFVQFLAGPIEAREGRVGVMLRLIAQITLLWGPLALLIFFLLKFLPYHHEPITWWQRIAVACDLALLWALWPSVARGEASRITWRDFRRVRVAAAALASLATIVLVFGIITFPGESLDDSRLFRAFASPRDLLLGGSVNSVSRSPSSLWSNRLVLPGIDVIDHAKFDTEAKIAALPQTLSLRGRRLEGAVLLGAGLRKVDFTGAQLQGAELGGADLRDADFGCGSLSCANLQGVLLVNALLPGANLDNAQLDGAILVLAQLQGATLMGAELRAADLTNAQLQGANLDGAKLEGASLRYAHLQGASLQRTSLNSVDLFQAFLWRANAQDATTEGAFLFKVETQPKYHQLGFEYCRENMCDWAATSYVTLEKIIRDNITKELPRREALRRIQILDPSASQSDEQKSAEAWTNLASLAPSSDDYSKLLLAQVLKVACDGRSDVHVIRSIVRDAFYFRFQIKLVLAEFAAGVLNGAGCPGARGLSESDMAQLIRDRDRPKGGTSTK